VLNPGCSDGDDDPDDRRWHEYSFAMTEGFHSNGQDSSRFPTCEESVDYHLANSRCMFAWAFDRLLPEKLAEVTERTGSPVVAILLSAIGTELFLIVFTFWGNTATFFGGSTLGYLLAFGTTALAGLLWPLLRPDSFRRSPAAVQLFGLPLIQIAGTGTLLYFAFLFWAFLTNPAFGLARLGLVGFALYWLVGLGIFMIAWQVRRAQGIDLSLVYREVPAE
jgi:APA family basic amino acid/polyamine antiporter